MALMSEDAERIELFGFENDEGAVDLLSQFGVPDFKSTLPIHLTDVLRKQYPDLTITRIELLKPPTCNLGGMQHEGSETLVHVQQLHVVFALKVSVNIDAGRASLELELVLKCDDLDNAPRVTTDMFVKGQTSLE
jgi:hypothetical protein